MNQKIFISLDNYYQRDLQPGKIIKRYVDNGQIIYYIEQVNNQTGKKEYYKFYYNGKDDSYHNSTNIIYMDGGSKKTNTRPHLIGDFNRKNYEDELKNRLGNNFQPPQPIGLSIFNIPEDLFSNYLYTHKIDGNNSFIEYTSPNNESVILQAEYYNNQDYTHQSSKNDVFYVFDLIHPDHLDWTLKQRLEWIQQNVPDTKYIHKKQFMELKKSDTLQDLLKLKLDGIKTDGIIFSHIDQSYEKTEHLKLKPKECLTNDFKYIYNEKLKGYYLQTIGNKRQYMDTMATKYTKLDKGSQSLFAFYLPYVVNNNPTYSILITKSQGLISDKTLLQKFRNGELNNLIVETGYTDDMLPYPQRIRDDKIFPNNFLVCLNNYENRMNPIENYQGNQYFQKNDKSDEYQAFRYYGNQARRNCFDKIIDQVKGKKDSLTFLDFGSGRGVNLDKIIPMLGSQGIYYSLEPDRIAQVEQYRRIRDTLYQKRIKCPKIFLYDYSSNIKYHDIDLFISNYSIHYMLGNTQDINTLKQIFSHCKYFLFLYYSGERINKLLDNSKKEYNPGKYYIKKVSEKKISILIPTLSDKPYDEFLVFPEVLEKLTGEQIISEQVYKEKDIKEGDSQDKEYLQLIQFGFYKKE